MTAVRPSAERDRALTLPPLPLERPLLIVGHGTRDERGRQAFIDLVERYQTLDRSRSVVPCFLELCEPSIQQGIDRCVEQGHTEISVLPLLLFAARHNKFDITNELDQAKQRHPQLAFHYGRHLGIAPGLLELWRQRLAALDDPEHNPNGIPRAETVLLFVGRGSSDPDANGEACKLARMLWEGSGYKAVETCFIGITYPRLEQGFERARLLQPQRIVVLPHFLFAGVLMEKIFTAATREQNQFPHIAVNCLPEMGVQPQLLQLLRERELETQQGQVQMNCETCKFRLAAAGEGNHHHHHDNGHHHGDSHHHGDAGSAPYHDRIWQVP